MSSENHEMNGRTVGSKRSRPPVDYEMLAKQLDLEEKERKREKTGG